MDGNRALIEEIRGDIQQAGGRITFARFMERALYHPRHGYYTSGRRCIGQAGDYFTSVSVGPLFGRILARQFLHWRGELGPEFEVIEFGGQRGQLRDDVLAAAPGLKYRVVEVGTDRRAVRGRETDGAPGGRALPESMTGCVFSNEFLDALPVHRVRVVGGAWQEVYVGAASPPRFRRTGRGGDAAPTIGRGRASFHESTGPLTDPRLAKGLEDLPTHLMEGYQTEVNLRALDWLTDIAGRLRRGYVLTIDYGFERAEYFAPHHRDGHLQCYYRHTKNDNPYRHIGAQDITAHVEFTSLIEHGRQVGLEPVLFTDQSHYLLSVGESEIAEIVDRTAGKLSRERAAIHQLIHSSMGRAFRVLIQRQA